MSSSTLLIILNKRPTGLNGTPSEYKILYTDFLSEWLIFIYQQPHHRINKHQRCLSILTINGKQHHNTLTQQQSMRCILIEQKIIHIHYYDLYSHTLPKESQPRGSKILQYNFLRPFLGHHSYVLSLSHLCLGVKKIQYLKKNTWTAVI